ncbi:MAG: adventurous gliding motility lipoprotein CglC [Proteobacteria bacterium]|nr:adventurous gliding motility lipoprotein CglC [Cystobacterineae bacterium]MCL2258254.1 adventurous gliding motility lipoprotein CglC [Cystobacterineae bacterium]MCL2315415.1 adventurous gliding motility lipoprotein CglC [Pseudomonadota bacterium]
MKSKTILFYLATLLLPLASACTDTSDLGEPCFLLKAGPNETTQNITEKEAKDALEALGASNKDGKVTRGIISLGVPDCEDLACIRDEKFNPGPVADSAYAAGYCTERCSSEGSSCKAGNSKAKYVCRSLMQACESNSSSELCNNNNVKSSLFCTQE